MRRNAFLGLPHDHFLLRHTALRHPTPGSTVKNRFRTVFEPRPERAAIRFGRLGNCRFRHLLKHVSWSSAAGAPTALRFRGLGRGSRTARVFVWSCSTRYLRRIWRSTSTMKTTIDSSATETVAQEAVTGHNETHRAGIAIHELPILGQAAPASSIPKRALELAGPSVSEASGEMRKCGARSQVPPAQRKPLSHAGHGSHRRPGNEGMASALYRVAA